MTVLPDGEMDITQSLEAEAHDETNDTNGEEETCVVTITQPTSQPQSGNRRGRREITKTESPNSNSEPGKKKRKRKKKSKAE